MTSYFLREVNEYKTSGKYMNFHKYCVENWDVIMVDKIPHANIKNFFTTRNDNYLYFPTIGNYLLELYSIHADIKTNKNLEHYKKRHLLTDKCAHYKNCNEMYFISTFIEICNKLIKIIDSEKSLFNCFEFKTCHLTKNNDHNEKERLVLHTNVKWTSALSHGMIISSFVRCYIHTSNKKYLEYAKKLALEYDISVENGGFKRLLFDKFTFYEEYPTLEHGNYVLNGFMFALIGLYDLLQYIEDDTIKKSYEEGLYTLETILPLYDAGNGSYYDLIHLVGVVPIKARQQYHCTHIEQLKVMYLITNKIMFLNVHNRWTKYLKGFECSTN